MWSLTFMVDGKKRVERIPTEWVEEVRSLVAEGREYKNAVAEAFAINAQLLALWRKQNEKKSGSGKRKGR
jgi:transposase-like protein